jgi:hypothetical protein
LGIRWAFFQGCMGDQTSSNSNYENWKPSFLLEIAFCFEIFYNEYLS